MTFDIERLAAILRAASKAEIMPRFRRLGEGDVREKTSVIDLVTEADEAAERHIQGACAEAFPGAVFVGEESVAANPDLLGRVAAADLAIVVDPIDGTANFAAGAPMFGTMAAVVRGGETIAGLIYDPFGDDVVLAERGAGAFWVNTGGERTRLCVARPVPVEEMVGTASFAFYPPEKRRDLYARISVVRVLANYRNAAHEYRLMATGHVHFLLYHKLMPWDHLAGALIVTEAGGFVRRLDGSPYLPSHTEGGLLVTPDEASWRDLHRAVLAS